RAARVRAHASGLAIRFDGKPDRIGRYHRDAGAVQGRQHVQRVVDGSDLRSEGKGDVAQHRKPGSDSNTPLVDRSLPCQPWQSRDLTVAAQLLAKSAKSSVYITTLKGQLGLRLEATK